MEFIIITIFRPGKSWNFSRAHDKSWKSNIMLSENKRKKDEKLEK